MSWRAVLVVALSALFLAIAAPTIFARFPTAYTGAHAKNTTITTVDVDSPAWRAGLRPGDSIGCIDTRDYVILSTPFHQELGAYEPDPIRLCITTVVPVRHIEFLATPGPQSTPFYANTTLEVLRLFSYVVFLFVGCALVILRPSVMTWLLFGYCLSVAPVGAAYVALTVWPPQAYDAMMAVLSPTSALSAAFLFLFALLVPEERIPRDWRGWLFWAAAIGTIALIVGNAIYRMSVFGFLTPLNPTHRLLSNAMTFGVIVVIGARLLKMDSAARARFWWVAVAIVIGIVTNEVRQGTESFTPAIFGMLTVIMPLTLVYAIVRRHVIDIRFVISKAVVYGVLMTAIFGLIAAADWAATRFLAELRVALALDAVIAIGLGIMMHRLTPILEGWVDSVIYRKKHSAEIYLRRLARTLPRAEREETIDRALVVDPYDELDLTMAALLRRHGNTFTIALSAGLEGAALALDRDDDVVRFLVTERSCVHLDGLNDRVAATFAGLGSPTVAIPIFNGDELFGFVLYGVHRDGTRLDPEEASLLETLAESAGQAYVRVENSRLRALVGSAVQPAAS
jgi:hypothetical protein